MIPELHLLLENDPAAPPRKPENSWRWGTVVSTDPLAVRLDGESIPLATVPTTLTCALNEGQRVWVQMHGRAVIVLGAANGAVPTSTDTPWIRPTMSGGWGDVPFLVQAKYRRFNDEVHLRGVASGGSPNTTIFTLPAGFRPEGKLYFPVTGGNGTGQMEIGSDGTVVPAGIQSGAFVFLDVIRFIPDQ